MTRAFAASAALFALAVGGGVLWDVRDVPAPERRDGYVLLEAEMHAHTRFSDGFLSPFDLVIHARRQGLHAIAVTEHNLVFPGLLARWFARATGGPVVIVGEEVTSSRYHVHAYGIRDRVRPTYDPATVIDRVHAQGGLVVAAHPVREFWPALVPVRERLDGAEIMHPIAFGSARGAWSWTQMAEFFEGSQANGHRLTAIGASDYHFFSYLGLCRTWIFAREATEAGVMEALRAGRTVVRDHRGVLWGDLERVAALRAHPYHPKEHDVGYRGNGVGDRVARVLGWLGLIGMLTFRRRQT